LPIRNLSQDPRVATLARDLGLPGRGDCLAQLTQFALGKIDQIFRQWPDPIDSLDVLLQIAASRLSVCIEYIRTDSDLERIARDRAAYSQTLRETLQCEFVRGTSEGNLIEHRDPQPGDRRYLAIVDARGDRAIRAYFTAWHEMAHVLTTPPQLEFKLYRRTPAADEVWKDPLESAVDHIAGTIAFYEPIFGPALTKAVASNGRIAIEAIECARDAVAPSASLYSAILAAIRLWPEPLCFVRAEPRLKPAEQKKLSSLQQDLGLGLEPEIIAPKLRLVEAIHNDRARSSRLKLHAHLRVPTSSVISRVHQEQLNSEYEGFENQASWETSADGPLPSAAVRVTATRRGGSVYGLVSLTT
jgi:hypothetical protein